jgi:non-ribosomal peptide synthetase component F
VSPFELDPGTVQLDLNLTLSDSPSLYGELDYRVDLFEEATISWASSQLQCLFQQVVDDPQVRLSALRSLLTQADRTRWGEVGRGLGESRAESFRNRKRQAVAGRS